MYDTILLRLDIGDYESCNFMKHAIDYLDEGTLIEHTAEYGSSISGKIDNLKVVANRSCIKIVEGSLCKWYLGDNYQTMRRCDVERAIEKLSDHLHLPMDLAKVTRLDVATNLIMQYPTNVYYNHLGELRYNDRLLQQHSLYYQGKNGNLCFYDKNKEHKGVVPELYKGQNVLRYEQRYCKRVAMALQRPAVTGKSLYNESFYIDVVKRWLLAYEQIQKINNIELNFKIMKGVKELKQMGLISLVNQFGGELEIMNQIREAQKRGDIDRKQAMDMRKAIKEALKLDGDNIVHNEAVEELTKKVKEVTRYYR